MRGANQVGLRLLCLVALAAAVGCSLGGAASDAPTFPRASSGEVTGGTAEAAEEAKEIEMAGFDAWLEAHVSGPDPRPPVSFMYGETASVELLRAWTFSRESAEPDEHRTEWTHRYADPETGLVLTFVATVYRNYPAVEWVVWLENTGAADTPVLSEVFAGDLVVTAGESPSARASGPWTLHHARGSTAKVDDFEPLTTEIKRNETVSLAPVGGRSSDTTLPFFNLAFPGNHGVVVGVGWTGQWAASVERTGAASARLRTGLEVMNTYLAPGERIRLPATLLLFWAGTDRLRGNNVLRRLIVDHYTPAVDGRPTEPMVYASVHGTVGFHDSTERVVTSVAEAIARRDLAVDYVQVDAGWYRLLPHRLGADAWAWSCGNWTPDPERYPNGMRAAADAVHANGLKYILWFEPERAMVGTETHREHREFLIPPPPAYALPPEHRYMSRDGFHLLDLGNPEALAWAIATFSAKIGEWDLDVYRHDFNLHPVQYWRHGEADDRQGMNEIRYVMGLYEYFDALRRKHPHLVIDSSASGGRRIDFEMLRRTITFWRSDLTWVPEPQQDMTAGLSYWIPFHGVGAVSRTPYDVRSGMGAVFGLAINVRELTSSAVRRQVAELRDLGDLFLGDYYPLTAYSRENDVWVAWQFDRPDQGRGLVQAFRRSEAEQGTLELRLRNLESEAAYVVTDLDAPDRAVTVSGAALMGEGLSASVGAFESALFVYERVTVAVTGSVRPAAARW